MGSSNTCKRSSESFSYVFSVCQVSFILYSQILVFWPIHFLRCGPAFVTKVHLCFVSTTNSCFGHSLPAILTACRSHCCDWRRQNLSSWYFWWTQFWGEWFNFIHLVLQSNLKMQLATLYWHNKQYGSGPRRHSWNFAYIKKPIIIVMRAGYTILQKMCATAQVWKYIFRWSSCEVECLVLPSMKGYKACLAKNFCRMHMWDRIRTSTIRYPQRPCQRVIRLCLANVSHMGNSRYSRDLEP